MMFLSKTELPLEIKRGSSMFQQSIVPKGTSGCEVEEVIVMPKSEG